MSDDFNISTPRRARKKKVQFTSEERKAVQNTFLQALSMTANVRASCLKAGIDRSLVYKWQEHDQEFSMRFKIAQQEANDMLFGEAWRRGVQGVEKPVVSMGKVVYDENGKMLTTKEYSDHLLSLLLKARLPEFRDKQQVELIGKDGGVIQSNITIDTRNLSSEQLAQLKEFASGLK
jgi:hypothetical protein